MVGPWRIFASWDCSEDQSCFTEHLFNTAARTVKALFLTIILCRDQSGWGDQDRTWTGCRTPTLICLSPKPMPCLTTSDVEWVVEKRCPRCPSTVPPTRALTRVAPDQDAKAPFLPLKQSRGQPRARGTTSLVTCHRLSHSCVISSSPQHQDLICHWVLVLGHLCTE